MSAGYVAIQWTRHKLIYDACVLGAAALFIGAYVLTAKALYRGDHAISDEVLIIRAMGACAIAMLHVVLCIGPLARLDRRFSPILANRRHLGVITFLIALVHAVASLGYYHGFGIVSPLRSLLTTNATVTSLHGFAFEWLGAVALIVLFLMAATSHDFWLRTLSARVWKSLHMLVYPAYAMLIGHVALGAGLSDRGSGVLWLLAAGATLVVTLHLVAAVRERRVDHGERPGQDGWIDAGPMDDIPMDRATVVCAPGGERIAIFRHTGGVSAVTNVCAHQGGPLGEGRVIDGCITCPWHGWQYRPSDGCAPPPFTERIATHQVRIVARRVQVAARADAPGTPQTPAPVTDASSPRRTPEADHA